jgi:hypothetical protein
VGEIGKKPLVAGAWYWYGPSDSSSSAVESEIWYIPIQQRNWLYFMDNTSVAGMHRGSIGVFVIVALRRIMVQGKGSS